MGPLTEGGGRVTITYTRKVDLNTQHLPIVSKLTSDFGQPRVLANDSVLGGGSMGSLELRFARNDEEVSVTLILSNTPAANKGRAQKFQGVLVDYYSTNNPCWPKPLK